jgi:hypothetical protein
VNRIRNNTEIYKHSQIFSIRSKYGIFAPSRWRKSPWQLRGFEKGLQSTEVGDPGISVVERGMLSDQEIRTEEIDDHTTTGGKER